MSPSSTATKSYSLAKDQEDRLSSLVTPRTPAPQRLLFMTASYTTRQTLQLQKVIDSLKDICNAGWDVTILVHSADGLNATHSKFEEIKQQAYCTRINGAMPIVLETFEKNIGFGLNSRHRKFLKDHIDEHDYYCFAEEDMVLTLSHLTAYIYEMKKIKRVLPDLWHRYFIGFLRFACIVFDFLSK